jgi:selenoprotein W-related protein
VREEWTMENKPRVEIEYCCQCGFMLRAAWMAQELLKTFEEELNEVALKPGSGGHFIVRVNGRQLFSRKEAGRYPDAKELKELVRDAIGSDKHVGHPGRDKPAPA